jgi:hypothetical protein
MLKGVVLRAETRNAYMSCRDRGAGADDADCGAVDRCGHGVDVGGADCCDVVTLACCSEPFGLLFPFEPNLEPHRLILHQLTEYALEVIRIKDLLILLEDRATAGYESVDEIPNSRMLLMPPLVGVQPRYPRR